MSFSHAAFNVIALAAIVFSIFTLAREARPRRRNRLVRVHRGGHPSTRRNSTQAVP